VTKKPSLAETHPELASQAIGWDPTTLRPGSNRALQWKCSQGHIWKTMVNARTQGRGCAVCTNRKVVSGFNDLPTSPLDRFRSPWLGPNYGCKANTSNSGLERSREMGQKDQENLNVLHRSRSF